MASCALGIILIEILQEQVAGARVKLHLGSRDFGLAGIGITQRSYKSSLMVRLLGGADLCVWLAISVGSVYNGSGRPVTPLCPVRMNLLGVQARLRGVVSRSG